MGVRRRADSGADPRSDPHPGLLPACTRCARPPLTGPPPNGRCSPHPNRKQVVVSSLRRLAVASLLSLAAFAAAAGPAAALEPDGPDLDFILQQIKRAEAHAAGGALVGPGADQIANPLLPYGLRTVDGRWNNLLPGQS